jgi:hypothetical protein
MPTIWLVERTHSRRFPFRVSIEQDGRVVLAVRAQGFSVSVPGLPGC